MVAFLSRGMPGNWANNQINPHYACISLVDAANGTWFNSNFIRVDSSGAPQCHRWFMRFIVL